ncbi:MAG: HEAT repeat domain-containing protein [Planctomycetota bacterium]
MKYWLLAGIIAMIISGCGSPEKKAIAEAHQQKVNESLAQIAGPDQNTRTKAIKTLIDLNAREAIPALTGLLQDSDSLIRSLAVYALVKLNAKEAVPAIVKLLKNSVPEVRQIAVDALKQLDAKETIPEIAELLDDNDKKVRGVTAVVLVEFGAKDKITGKAMEDLKSLLEWHNDFSARARAALKELGVDDKSK